MRRVVGRQQLHAGHALEPLRPAVAQEPEARRLALRADAVQKVQRFHDGVVIRRRMGPDLLELAHVLVHLGRRRHHRPDLGDLRPADVEEPRADRRREPLVEARAVVVAVQLVTGKREMRVGVRPVHDHLDAARPAQLADLLHGKDLPRQVRDVTDVDDLGARRDRGFDAARQILLRRRRHGEGDLLQDDAVAPLALLPGGDHARVVLRGRQDLVAALQR